MNNPIYIYHYNSPAGEIILGALNDRISLCDWKNNLDNKLLYERIKKEFKTNISLEEREILVKAKTQLDEYFLSKRECFDIPISLIGTDFQKMVWSELLKIPYGKVVSYSDIAEALMMPRSVRAISNVIGANKILILIPCHREIGRAHV